MAVNNKYLEAGKIVNTHSFKGEVKVQCWCDTPNFLEQFDGVFLDDKGENKLVIKNMRIVNSNTLICAFEGVETEEAAIKLKNKIIYIDRDDAVLEDGTFFIRDLIGLQVFDFNDKNIKYGELTDIFNNGANDIYVIKTERRTKETNKNIEVLVPNVPDFVKKVSLEDGIFIVPIEGMF